MNLDKPTAHGTFYGVGVGPGDPELLTRKAVRLIRAGHLLCYISNPAGYSMAKEIADDILPQDRAHPPEHYPIVIPMCTARAAIEQAYTAAAERIAAALTRGHDVVFICEGDPFFFGSFTYLHARLSADYATEVVPGVTSISAAAAAAGHPLGSQAEGLAIVSGRHSDAEILAALADYPQVVIIKAGRRRARLVELLTQAGRSQQACYLEYVGYPHQRLVRDLRQLNTQPGAYFSLFLVAPRPAR